MNIEPSGETLEAKVKRLMAANFEARMGMVCSVRFHKNGSVAYVVKEQARFNETYAGLFADVPQDELLKLSDNLRAPSEVGPPPPDDETRFIAGILEETRSQRGEIVSFFADRRDLVTLWRERLENLIRDGLIFQFALKLLFSRAIRDFSTDDSEMTVQSKALLLAALEYTDVHPDAYADVEPLKIADEFPDVG